MKKALFVLTAIFFAACSYSTANLSDIKACTAVSENQCMTDEAIFSADTPEIFISAVLNNAPTETTVKFTWRYLEENLDIAEVDLVSEEITSKMQSSLTKPTAGWPKGKYEVVLKIGTDNAEPVHKEFSIQ